MENVLINKYGLHIKNEFGQRVQKITIDADFTCPNRDGTVGVGGCTFCNNDKFNPGKANLGDTVSQQIRNQITNAKKRYKKVTKFIVYFQTYSNTYAPLDKLKELYEEALSFPEVIGLSIGTRADCVDEDKINYLEELAKNHHITIEYGIESTLDSSLKKINRGHDYNQFLKAISLTTGRGIKICVHLIIGFPWENKQDHLESAQKLSCLPIDYLKVHQLHVVKNTIMGNEYLKSPFKTIGKEEYMDILCDFVAHLRPSLIVQRLFGDVPTNLLLSPAWDKKKSNENMLELEEKLKEKSLFQGKFFKV